MKRVRNRRNVTYGNITQYIYAADGRKLRERHTTAVSGLTVNLGSTLALTPATTLAVDSLDYADNLRIRNQQFSQVGIRPKVDYYYAGGFMSLTPSAVGYPITVIYDLSFHSFLRDHQGNVRVVADGSGNEEQLNDYYPYGCPYGDTSTNQGFQPYKYNGKELDRMHGLDWYDYGARRYDPAYCMFTQMDPLAEQYPHLSPYAYCAGNPVNAVDPDGNLIIFINGFHKGNEGGCPNYWGGFDTAVMNHFNDDKHFYRDGALGGIYGLNKYLLVSNLNPRIRYNAGIAKGMKDAETIFSNLQRNKDGIIIESIKLISHSMGGAYAKGYAQALVNYIKNHPLSTSGASIAEYDFAPFEPSFQTAVQGVDTYQYSHKYDRIAGSKPIKGAHYMKTSTRKKDGHQIKTFKEIINDLPEGEYIFDNGIPIKVN